MISSDFLRRLLLWATPAALLGGLGFSAAVGWYAATASGGEAGWRIFILLGLITVIMAMLLAWSLRIARMEAARAESALEKAGESAERLRELLELSSDWYWEQDAQFRFTSMSGGVVNKGGYNVNDTLGKTRWELPIHAPDPEVWRRHREQLERREPFYDLRYDIRVVGGSLRTYSINGRPRFAAGGTFLGYRGTGKDITKEERTKDALRESRERLALVIEATQDGIWDHDPIARKTYFSARFIELLGYDNEEEMRDRFFFAEALHPEDKERVLAVIEQAFSSGGRIDETYRMRRKDGSFGWFRGRGQALQDESGRTYRFAGTITDITPQLEFELKLRLAASVFEHSLEGVTITDAERNIISVNRAFTRITGYEAAEVIGKNPRLLKSGRQDDAFYAAMWQAIDEDGFWSGEIWNRRKSGEIYPEHLSITAVRDERGRPLHYIGIFTDITDVKHAEEAIRAMNANLERRVRERTAELEASNRELEAFSYSVSHDLRAPLRGIDGFAHILAEDYGDRLDEAGRGYLARIRRASQRLSQTIDDMIELARITRTPLHRGEVDLSSLARAIVQELAQSSAHRPEAVVADSLTAQADPALARIVLQNLLDNAWKFTARTAHARIEFGAAADGHTFYVRDNGAGFEPSYAGKLFQPFQRLHHPGEFSGAGIGLATVKRIVERHGGRVWAESHPGKGATFWFTLP